MYTVFVILKNYYGLIKSRNFFSGIFFRICSYSSQDGLCVVNVETQDCLNFKMNVLLGRMAM